MPKEVENFITDKIYLFKISLRKEVDFLSLKPYNVKKVVCDETIIRKYSAIMFDNVDNGDTSKSLDDLFLEDCDRLSPIVNLGNDDDSLQVFYNIFKCSIVSNDYYDYIITKLFSISGLW